MSQEARLRVDKWLWQARFFKTRGLAAELVGSGQLRLNGAHVRKAAQVVKPGDTLTFPQGGRIRVIRVLGIGTRRGPAPEAQALYHDLTPEVPRDPAAPAAGPAPSRRERDRARALKRSALE
ncbi:RNA-binding S4 domain-containing protein [Mangrovicoccus algicola]|uniref:RNA-binding S4 domain-containing protein n=1 Tax=Mangrovicoccus algicola TaxID=2771008 RepID=A0A8J6YTF3_9RHOB|nr:RNA-binding S4 domain-containing protein [Mangrovicoccus algicola]MBE3637502.1 RNA-binding S4 domain-containing protein [Mangrovicoccus algicola]